MEKICEKSLFFIKNLPKFFSINENQTHLILYKGKNSENFDIILKNNAKNIDFCEFSKLKG